MPTTPFFFDPQTLESLAQQYGGDAYAKADPYPHCVIDNFLPQDVADELYASFPGPDQIKWKRADHGHEVKASCEDETQFPSPIRQFLHACNASVFVSFLEKLTGIEGLVSDPHFRGAGMAYIPRGGKLGIHADFNMNKRLKLDRRLNAILYMNKDWKDEFGGHFELWSRDMKTCVKKVLPLFNRLVVFSTTDDAFHGHPDPLTCPEGMSRKSISLYYFSNGRPEHERGEMHSTLFKLRPGEKVLEKIRWRDASRYVPPIMVDIAKNLRQK